jgi:CRP/FNR family transcriptional regulator, cyclic AMP receptor protein
MQLEPDKRQILRTRGWLSLTPTAFQDEVLKRCRPEIFRRGESVFHLDDEYGGIYGLVEGGLSISAAPRDRGPYLVHFGRPGLWVGAAPLFKHRRRVTVTATRHSVLLHLPLNDMHAIAAETPDGWRMFGMFPMYLYDIAMGALDDLMIRDPATRCIAVLLRLGDCRDPAQPETGPIELDVRQEDIAMMSNLSRNAAATVLRDLEVRGVISLEYRIIKILNAEALRNAAKPT